MLISAFMTNNLNVQDAVNNLNIDKIIEKPIRLEILKEEVEKLMKQQQQQQQPQQPFQISMNKKRDLNYYDS
jgi:response regulator RpfG family c-di-GMP phosphodiesterase